MAKLFLILLLFSNTSAPGQKKSLSDSLFNDFIKKLENSKRSMDSMINPLKYASTFEEFLSGNFSKNSTKDGKWVYYKDNANIQQLNKPEVSKVIPGYNFYKVQLTNYLGYHINSCSNLVLFDSVNKKMIHPEPMWYSDNNEEFINLFIGKKFRDSTALMAFVYEFQDLLRVGSTGKFANTKYKNIKVTFDDTFEGARGIEVWRRIEIYIKDNTIIEYHSINPR